MRSLVPVGLLEAAKGASVIRSLAGRTVWFPKMYSLVRYTRLDLLPPWGDLREALIVDVGANRGDWTAAVRKLLPDVHILAVEPDPRSYQKLRRRFSGDSNVEVVNMAIGSSSGRADFFMAGHDHASSLLQPLEQPEERYPIDPDEWKVVDKVEVEVAALDDLLRAMRPALIKIDVQGGERELLAGAREVLKTTPFVLIEAVMDHHYQGDAVFAELDVALRAMGFRLQGFSDTAHDAHGSVVWFDACYARRN